MSVTDLPLLNAFLNATSGVLLLIGHRFILKGKRDQHKRIMLTALFTSSLFLISYIVYHSIHGSQHFQGVGIIRPVYFLVLGTHTVCAAAIVPLVLMTVTRGLRRQFAEHRKIARWTYPIWMYVSITGVIIYLMLYQFYPAGGIS